MAARKPRGLAIIGIASSQRRHRLLGDQHVERQARQGSGWHDEEAFAWEQLLELAKEALIKIVCDVEVEGQRLARISILLVKVTLSSSCSVLRHPHATPRCRARIAALALRRAQLLPALARRTHRGVSVLVTIQAKPSSPANVNSISASLGNSIAWVSARLSGSGLAKLA